MEIIYSLCKLRVIFCFFDRENQMGVLRVTQFYNCTLKKKYALIKYEISYYKKKVNEKYVENVNLH